MNVCKERVSQINSTYLPVVQPICRARIKVPRIQCGSISLAIPLLLLEDLIEVHRSTKNERDENKIKVSQIIKLQLSNEIL